MKEIMNNRLLKSAALLTMLFGFHGSVRSASSDAAKQSDAANLLKASRAAAEKKRTEEAERAYSGDKKKAIADYNKKIADTKTSTADRLEAIKHLAVLDPDSARQAKADESAKLQQIINSDNPDTTDGQKKAALDALRQIDPDSVALKHRIIPAVTKAVSRVSEKLDAKFAADIDKLFDGVPAIKKAESTDGITKQKLIELIVELDELKKTPIVESEEDKKKREKAIEAKKKKLDEYIKRAPLSVKELVKSHDIETTARFLTDKAIQFGEGLTFKKKHTAKNVDGDEEAQANSTKKKVTGGFLVGSGILSGGTVISGLLTLLGIEQQDDKDYEREIDRLRDDLEDGKSPHSPSAYGEPAADSDCAQKISMVANFIGQNLVEAFIKATESEDYYNKNFKIKLDPVTIDNTEHEFVVEFNFEEEGAGNPGAPLICKVSITPEEIDGCGINIDTLTSLINSEDQDACSLILNPNAAFLFFLKAALLNKDVLNDSSLKNDFDKIQKIRTHTMILCARLAQTKQYANTSMQELQSNMPSAISKYIDNLSTKVYADDIKSVQSAQQNSSVLQEAILTTRSTALNYNEIIQATTETVVPLITDGLSFSDQKLIVHANLRLIADLGDKLPKSAADQTVELKKRMGALIPFVTTTIKSVISAGFEKKDIDSLKKTLAILNEIKSGKKTITQNIAKPRLGEPKSEVQDELLVSTLDIYLQQFQALREATLPKDFLLGKSETSDALIAVFLRGIKMVSDAYNNLITSKATSIKLRNSSGVFTINPSEEFEKCTKESNEKMSDASDVIAKAVKALRANHKKTANKKAYDDAKNELVEASISLHDGMQKFRSLYAPYLPMKVGKGPDKTALEFVREAIKVVSSVGQKDAFTSMLSEPNYALFENALGLPVKAVYGQSIAVK
ncbi:MAG: hypothetical protein US49_C0003G0089 [candidate division TM6 bacterium GW2011_GWF2_37_49]|nr:MAG: hypothetical protein US49_C0003G0089 [candidate division TM6 bacterium GW2011_GWF2_37_49]